MLVCPGCSARAWTVSGREAETIGRIGEHYVSKVPIVGQSVAPLVKAAGTGGGKVPTSAAQKCVIPKSET